MTDKAMVADACDYVASLIAKGWLIPGTKSVIGMDSEGHTEPYCAVGWVMDIAGCTIYDVSPVGGRSSIERANDREDWPLTVARLRERANELRR